MKNEQKQLKYVLLVAMFMSIQIVMAMIPFLGFIPLGFVNITTLHLPTILAGVLLGAKAGALVGGTFGLMSVIRATFFPGLLSFWFSPFAPAPAGFDGNPLSLVVAFVPRILLGVFAAYLFQLFKERKFEKAGMAFTAFITAGLHTLMVLGLVYLIFQEQIIVVIDAAENARGVAVFLWTIVVNNAIFEMLLAAVLVTVVGMVLQPIVRKMVK